MTQEDLLQVANQLYRAVINRPCSCATRWEMGIRVLLQQCHRCIVIARWEEVAELAVPTPRLAQWLPPAGSVKAAQ